LAKQPMLEETPVQGNENLKRVHVATPERATKRAPSIAYGSIPPIIPAERVYQTQVRSVDFAYLRYIRDRGSSRTHQFDVLRRIEGRKPAFQIGLEIRNILEPDVEPQRRAARRPFGRGTVAVAIEGNRQALEAAPGIAHAE
jgi:hypothetical protein